MTLPIHAENAEREFTKASITLIRTFEDLNVEKSIREYMIRMIDDAFKEATRQRKKQNEKSS